uniref:Uncharacterized protein n=1 Tax=Anopheles quadriannulatus TaxID=34691 RepID=A0A182XGY9_ANOQN
MVVLEGGTMGTSLLGGPYAQGAPALKMMQKRYVGLHQWLSPMCATKDLKEHLSSAPVRYLVSTSFGFRQHKKRPCGENILSLEKEFDACPRCKFYKLSEVNALKGRTLAAV